MTKFQQRCSVLSVLVPALGLAGCMASPDDVARIAQPISEADGGVADGSTGDGSASPFVEAPRPPTVRTARDVAAFLDRVARRSRLGGGSARFEPEAASLTALVPRTPHPKQTSGWTCDEFTGPSVVRLKFVEGTSIRLNPEILT